MHPVWYPFCQEEAKDVRESWRDFHSLNSLYDMERVGRIWVKSTHHLCFALIFHFWYWKELKDRGVFSEWSHNFSCPPRYNLKILAFSLSLGKYLLVLEMNQSLPIHSVRITNNLLYDLQLQGKLAFWSVSKCRKCVANSLKVQILILLLSCCWATCLTNTSAVLEQVPSCLAPGRACESPGCGRNFPLPSFKDGHASTE